MNREILLPLFAMIGLTLAVLALLMISRTRASLKLRNPQILAEEARAQEVFKASTHLSDNFENLFELPALFYTAVLTILAMGIADATFVTASWIFVVLRIAHTGIHCTYNRITHRFAVYALGGLCLTAIWLRIAVSVFQGP